MTDVQPLEVSAHADPDGEAPWVMQIVCHVERNDPPSHTAICEATAIAVVRLLADDRAISGEWAPAVERWMTGRIRKHARKARGAQWDKVQALPGMTVAHRGAEVRAFVPCPTDDVPRDIARLQLQGFDLADDDRVEALASTPDGPLVVSVCPDPVLETGKAAAACGHAAQIARMGMPADRLAGWAAAGFPVVVEHPSPARWNELVAAVPIRVVDAGFTAVPSGTTTSLARWA